MGDLTIKLNYSKEATLGTKPYWITYERTPEEIAKSHLKTNRNKDKENEVPVVIKDARGLEDKLTLNTHSFQLVKWKTALSTRDFYENENKIHQVYYKEMEDVLKKYTGASYVHIFHHQLRNAEQTTQTKESGDNCKIHKYAGRIHLDYHGECAKNIFKDMRPQIPKECRSGRFLFINIWRNISDEPVGNDHMAMCDETSLVYPDDVIAADYFDKLFPVQHYRLLDFNSAKHRWYYYPKMQKDEVLLFKQWDSDTTQKGRMCFHTSFFNDKAPPCPARQSIEIRTVIFFPDHTPNTCPSLDEECDEDMSFMHFH